MQRIHLVGAVIVWLHPFPTSVAAVAVAVALLPPLALGPAAAAAAVVCLQSPTACDCCGHNRMSHHW
jgi:hypothetical protein